MFHSTPTKMEWWTTANIRRWFPIAYQCPPCHKTAYNCTVNTDGSNSSYLSVCLPDVLRWIKKPNNLTERSFAARASGLCAFLFIRAKRDTHRTKHIKPIILYRQQHKQAIRMNEKLLILIDDWRRVPLCFVTPRRAPWSSPICSSGIN